MIIAVFYNLPFGGAKRVVQEHVKGLKELGHIVDVYSYSHEDDMFEPGMYADATYSYKAPAFKINLPILKRVVRDFNTFVLLKSLNRKIAKEIDFRKYDLVLVHLDTYIYSPYILKFLKTKNVYFCLEPYRAGYEYSLRFKKNDLFNYLYESLNRLLRKLTDQDNARSADHTLAISRFGREYMIHAFNLYPQVSYLGVNENVFKPVSIKKKNQILFVAEKEYIYGYDLMEKAVDLLPKRNRPVVKYVFGTKKSQRITDEDLVRMYNESLVTLSLSRFDTFGLVPLESMACETPVIALDVAGYRETVVNDETGFLVEFDPGQIAEKIKLLMDDPKLAEKIGKRGRVEVLKKWTWKTQIKNLHNIITQYA